MAEGLEALCGAELMEARCGKGSLQKAPVELAAEVGSENIPRTIIGDLELHGAVPEVLNGSRLLCLADRGGEVKA